MENPIGIPPGIIGFSHEPDPLSRGLSFIRFAAGRTGDTPLTEKSQALKKATEGGLG